jgi:ATP-dependent RNA circularization protein (DNA/RNA ligase family)
MQLCVVISPKVDDVRTMLTVLAEIGQRYMTARVQRQAQRNSSVY